MVSTKWSITKNGVLPVTTLFFWKFCFSWRTSYKELIWCTNDPNAHIRTFCKRWSFIWRCFFPVSILPKRFHNHRTFFINIFDRKLLNLQNISGQWKVRKASQKTVRKVYSNLISNVYILFAINRKLFSINSARDGKQLRVACRVWVAYLKQ